MQVLIILAIVLLPLLCGPINMQKRLKSISAFFVIGPTFFIESFLIVCNLDVKRRTQKQVISSWFKTVEGAEAHEIFILRRNLGVTAKREIYEKTYSKMLQSCF